MQHSKLSTFESTAIIITLSITYTLVGLLKVLIDESTSSIIINLLYVSILAFVLISIIIKLLKNFHNFDIIDISEYIGGILFKRIVGVIFISYFIYTSAIVIRNFSECLKIVYYPLTNISFIILTFIIVLCLIGKLNFSSIAKVNTILLPIFIFSVFFVFISNTHHYSLEHLTPIFDEKFAEMVISSIGNICAYSGILFIYFIPAFLKDPKKLSKTCFLGLFISILYLVITAVMSLFLYSSSIEINQISLLYSMTRNIDFSTFFQRLDSIFLLLWILQIMSFISINHGLSLYITKKIGNLKDVKPISYIFALITFCIAILPENYAISFFLESFIYDYLIILVGFIFAPVILVISNLKYKKKENTLDEKNY